MKQYRILMYMGQVEIDSEWYDTESDEVIQNECAALIHHRIGFAIEFRPKPE